MPGNKMPSIAFDGGLLHGFTQADFDRWELFGKMERHRIAFGSNEFDKKLLAFAEKRSIAIISSGWRQRALEEAAREHPDLSLKKRGRPKEQWLGLLGRSNAENAALSALGLVEAIKAEAIRLGKRLSDRRACEVILAQQNLSRDDIMYASRLQVLTNKISKARKLNGTQRRQSITKK